VNHFTPLSALAGGILIGLATTLYLWLTGRYAGLSGILRSAAFGDPDRKMDALFMIGLVLGGALWFAFSPHAPYAPSTTSLWIVAIAGVLVGFGTALGNGCTSGHGVCGLGRFSGRSLVAVLAFMATGIATVFITRHVIGIG
jgi:uncharacterized membrane protein YedE/YeeE